MNIAVVYPASREHCGFRNLGDQIVGALRRTPGVRVSTHDGTFGHEWRPWPLAQEVDQILLVWHPGIMSHYHDLKSWPDRANFSIYVGEIPPYAICPILDRASTTIAADAFPGVTISLGGIPIVDWVTPAPTIDGLDFVVGTTGVRRESADAIGEICHREGWRFNQPTTKWLSVEDEIQRLAQSSINVCWYLDRRLESASAPSMCLASHRPLLINDSPMLDHVSRLPNVEQWGSLELGLRWASQKWLQGKLKQVPPPKNRSWSAAAARIVQHWQLQAVSA